jgi:chromosome segregation ATPase
MKVSHSFASVFLSLLFVAPGAQAANEPNPAEARLREGLKNTMLQLRAAEAERATLQVAQAQAAEQKKALEARVEALTKQSVADREAAAELTGKLADARTEITRLNESLDKWKKSHGDVTAIAQKKEAERAAAASQVIVLQRQVADQQRKNAEMFKLGNEILKRYERFGLGDALTAREPFIGTTRVKFQNLIQDYGDKLTDQKTKP